MLGRLFLLFTIVPFIELFLLMQVGDVVGFWPTVGMILLTGITGAWLSKREGLRVFREYQQALAEMRMPKEGLTSGLLVLVGGVLMIAPGVLTDITGILLMIPPVRRVVAGWVERYVEKHILGAKAGGGGFRQVQTSRGVAHVWTSASGVKSEEPVAKPVETQKTGEPEALVADVVVDRRGRIIAELEDGSRR